MIECSPDNLPVAQENQLKVWLRDPAAKIFIRILEHRAKRLQVQAMNDAQSNTDGYANLAGESAERCSVRRGFRQTHVRLR
jgi:hypothetical protein